MGSRVRRNTTDVEFITVQHATVRFTGIKNSSSSVAAGEAVSAALPNESLYMRADISNHDEADGLIDRTIEQFGRLDYLINNAGWTTVIPHEDLDALTDDIFQKTFDVNVFGTWRLTKRAIPHLRESDDPNIVNVTSIAGVRPVGSSMAYSMTKAALNQMVHSGAIEIGRSHRHAICVALHPGTVETPLTEKFAGGHTTVTPEAAAKNLLDVLAGLTPENTGQFFDWAGEPVPW